MPITDSNTASTIQKRGVTEEYFRKRELQKGEQKDGLHKLPYQVIVLCSETLMP